MFNRIWSRKLRRGLPGSMVRDLTTRPWVSYIRTMRMHRIYRIVAVTVLTAFVLSATVPHFCSTGWCCATHQATSASATAGQATEEAAPESDCCGGGPQAPATDETDCCGGGGISMKQSAPETDCCGGGHSSSGQTADNSCDQSCATGCCKLAATAYVFANLQTSELLHPVAIVTPAEAHDTGIELSDYVPQPPSLLSA